MNCPTLIALALLATGVSLATLVTKPWQLILLWGVVVGAGSGMAALAGITDVSLSDLADCADAGRIVPIGPRMSSPNEP
jgi:hypothetical protein